MSSTIPHTPKRPQVALESTLVAFGLPHEEGVRAVTWYAARALGLEDRLGSLAPGKLADVAKNADVAHTILYIVEGDSAGGSCKQARNNRHHAILPLRGKILNTERANLNRALSNNEVKAIVSAVGAGVGRDFRVEDMRYGGVAIFVDADVDFVSRFFAPSVGIDEDPVTGSAHCTLVPYWSERTGRPALLAHQLSARGGVIRCRDRGERVDIAGPARFWLEGRIEIVMGNEAAGLSELWRGDDTQAARVPLLGKVDSLNVSVATAVCLFEINRQRGAA